MSVLHASSASRGIVLSSLLVIIVTMSDLSAAVVQIPPTWHNQAAKDIRMAEELRPDRHLLKRKMVVDDREQGIRLRLGALPNPRTGRPEDTLHGIAADRPIRLELASAILNLREHCTLARLEHAEDTFTLVLDHWRDDGPYGKNYLRKERFQISLGAEPLPAGRYRLRICDRGWMQHMARPAGDPSYQLDTVSWCELSFELVPAKQGEDGTAEDIEADWQAYNNQQLLEVRDHLGPRLPVLAHHRRCKIRVNVGDRHPYAPILPWPVEAGASFALPRLNPNSAGTVLDGFESDGPFPALAAGTWHGLFIHHAAEEIGFLAIDHLAWDTRKHELTVALKHFVSGVKARPTVQHSQLPLNAPGLRELSKLRISWERLDHRGKDLFITSQRIEQGIAVAPDQWTSIGKAGIVQEEQVDPVEPERAAPAKDF